MVAQKRCWLEMGEADGKVTSSGELRQTLKRAKANHAGLVCKKNGETKFHSILCYRGFRVVATLGKCILLGSEVWQVRWCDK